MLHKNVMPPRRQRRLRFRRARYRKNLPQSTRTRNRRFRGYSGARWSSKSAAGALPRILRRAFWATPTDLRLKRNRFLMEHDLFGKPVSTFPDHALSVRALQISHRIIGKLARITLAILRRFDDPLGDD